MTDINSAEFKAGLDPFIQHQVYNALDTCVTREVFDRVAELPINDAQISYDFIRAMQAPALELMLRGIRVDQYEIAKQIVDLEAKENQVEGLLNRYGMALWGAGLNPRSHMQLKALFYDVMGIPPVLKKDHKTGERKPTTDRDALEKIAAYYPAEPLVVAILKAREIRKTLGVLRTNVDADGRWRTSYNIAGTETARWSSSRSVWDTGSNNQNITGKLRRIFIADPGKKFAYIDLSQAESRILGLLILFIFGDPKYLDVQEAGDLHTFVSRIVWPDMPWTGDLKKDRELAEQRFYRDFSYRDMAKRGGHGTNYMGTAWTMAKHLKVPQSLIDEFQRQYLGETGFPYIPAFWRWVAEQIQVHKYLVTPLGRVRNFFGRVRDDKVLREAVAFLPQSTVAELLNLALWRIWRYMNELVEIMAQLHDAVLIQYKEEDEEHVLPLAKNLMKTEFKYGERTVIIPSDIEVGWNWAKYDPKEPLDNPYGLMKWKGRDDRERPKALGLDHILS